MDKSFQFVYNTHMAISMIIFNLLFNIFNFVNTVGNIL
jgi:hypothetical protein